MLIFTKFSDGKDIAINPHHIVAVYHCDNRHIPGTHDDAVSATRIITVECGDGGFYVREPLNLVISLVHGATK